MIAAQVAHAAGAGSERHPPGVHVVVLSARDESQVRLISRQLSGLGVAHTLVEEIDPPYFGEAMSIGLELVDDRRLSNQVLSSLPLLRGTTKAPTGAYLSMIEDADP